MTARFEGKVALVTGGASGIGLATALALASEGARVVVADISAEAAGAAVAEIVRHGGEASPICADLRDFEACRRMVGHAMQTFGGLHVAINNAGINDRQYAEFEEIDLADWDRVLATNVGAIVRSMKAEVPALRASGGTAIVNTASAAAIRGVPGKASYVASKHAVAGLTRAAALDLARHGIRVNAVCPGLTETPMIGAALANPDLRNSIAARTPMGRMAGPEEVARTILYAASGDASYVTGALLLVDGGLTAM